MKENTEYTRKLEERQHWKALTADQLRNVVWWYLAGTMFAFITFMYEVTKFAPLKVKTVPYRWLIPFEYWRSEAS